MIAYVVVVFICITLINNVHAGILGSTGFSWRNFLYRISENNGKKIYFPLGSVFCFLMGFILIFNHPVVGYLMLIPIVLLTVVYTIRLKGFKLPCDGALYVFIISEIITVLIVLAGYFTGGAILGLLFILSYFLTGFSNFIYVKLTSKRIREAFAVRDLAGDKTVICILSSFKQDIASIIAQLCENRFSCRIYERISPRIIADEDAALEDIHIYSNEIEGVTNTLELLVLLKPDIAMVFGAKGDIDPRIIEELKKCSLILSDNKNLLELDNCKNAADREYDAMIGLDKDDGLVLGACITAAEKIGVAETDIENNLNKLFDKLK